MHNLGKTLNEGRSLNPGDTEPLLEEGAALAAKRSTKAGV